MDVKFRNSPSKNARALTVSFLTAGYGELDTKWSDSVINTPYSRFYIVLDGEFFIETDSGEKMQFSKGNAYLIPSGSSYSFWCEDKMRHVYFHIRLCASDRIDRLSEIKKPISVNYALPYGSDELIRMTLSDAPTDFFIIESCVRSLLCDMLRENGITLENTEYSPEISSVITYISDNLSLKLTIDELAREARLAKSTLTRRFREEMGMSIGEYIDNLIMRRAERMLTSSDASVLEISDRFGFCDQFYFSRRFKEKYGTSPREYRKRPNV